MMVETTKIISNAEIIVIAIFFAVIIVFGCFLNGLIVVTYLKCRQTLLTQAKDVFILSVAMGDFFMSSLASPVGFSAVVSKEWTTGHAGCVWYGFVTTWVGLSSMLLLAAIAVERYVTLAQLNLNQVSKARAVYVVASGWFLAFATSCFPLIGWSKYTFESYGFHCSILWDSQTASNASYNLFLFVVFFIIPIIVIVLSYGRTYLRVRAFYRNASETWGEQAQGTRDCYEAEVKTAKRLVLVTAGFMFAWTPYSVVSMFKIIGGFDIPVAYQEYPALCAKMSAVYNPLLYFFSYNELRVKAFQFLKADRNVVHPESEFDSEMADTVEPV